MNTNKKQTKATEKPLEKQYFKVYTNIDFDYKKNKVLLEKLNKKQSKIKLTTFPIKLIKSNNEVEILQILYLYKNKKSITKYLNSLEKEEKFFEIKRISYEIINIIEELLDNKIYYLDLNLKNFLLDCNNKVQLSNFEQENIKLKGQANKKIVIVKLIYLIRSLYDMLGVDNYDIEVLTSLEELMNYVNNSTKIVQKKLEKVL